MLGSHPPKQHKANWENIPRTCIELNSLHLFVSNGTKLQLVERQYTGPLRDIDLSTVGPMTIQELVFNQSQVYLAISSEKNVAVADLSLFKEGIEDYEKHIKLYSIGSTNSRIISVLWHPASSTNTHLVLLTTLSVSIFDLTIDFKKPQYKVKFDSLPQLKGQNITSMAFGSSDSYSGSITLYITTKLGEVYALSPFIYNDFPQKFSGKMLKRFLTEGEEIDSVCDAKIPPAAIFNSLRHSLVNHKSVVAKLHNLYRSFNMGSFPETREWRFKAFDLSSTQAVGPIAKLNTECRLLNVNSNLDTTMLACLSKSVDGDVLVSYLVQLSPLIYGFVPSRLYNEPKQPALIKKPPSHEMYVKPRRGFGFQVVTEDSEDVQDTNRQIQEEYSREMLNYKALKESSKFLTTTFNQLTTITTDVVGSCKLDLDDIVWKSKKSFLLLGFDGKIVASDLSQTVCLISDPSQKVIDPSYYSKSIDVKNFTIYNASSLNDLSIMTSELQVQKFISVSPSSVQALPLTYMSETREKKDGQRAVTPADELQAYLENPLAIPAVKKVDINSSESLREIYNASSAAIQRIQNLTRFIFALQSTLAIQHGELNLQHRGLSELPLDTQSVHIKDTQTRIKSILDRQEQLECKVKALQSQLNDRFEQSKKILKLPLSNAEKAWFKELNSVTKKISVDDNNSLCLLLIVKNLSDRVAALQKTHSSAKDEHTESLETLHMHKTWKRLYFLLDHEGVEIAETKLSLDDLIGQLEDLNIGLPVK